MRIAIPELQTMVFEPGDLDLMQAALDQACKDIPRDAAVRTSAALAILAAFREGQRELEVLVETGVAALAAKPHQHAA